MLAAATTPATSAATPPGEAAPSPPAARLRARAGHPRIHRVPVHDVVFGLHLQHMADEPPEVLCRWNDVCPGGKVARLGDDFADLDPRDRRVVVLPLSHLE